MSTNTGSEENAASVMLKNKKVVRLCQYIDELEEQGGAVQVLVVQAQTLYDEIAEILAGGCNVSNEQRTQLNRMLKRLQAARREMNNQKVEEQMSRMNDAEQVLEVIPSSVVQTEEVPEPIVSVILSSPTPPAVVVEEKPEPQRRKFIPRKEWPDCPNPHELPNCMGQCAPLRDKDGFHKLCKVCHLYEKETEHAVAVVGEGERVEEQVQGAAIVEVQVAHERELDLLYKRRGTLPVGKQRYATVLVNKWKALLASQIVDGPKQEVEETLQVAIDYLRENLPEDTATKVDQQLVVQSLTGLAAIEEDRVNEELRFCPRCGKKKPVRTFFEFENRYPWLPDKHDILNWVEKEICADCVGNLNKTARKLRTRDECPRCHKPVLSANRKSFEVRHPVPENHWTRRWENGPPICWECIKYLAGKAFEASQELVAKVVKTSPPIMPEEAWKDLLKTDDTKREPREPMRVGINEPLVDENKVVVRQPRRIPQRVLAEATV